MIPKIIHQTWKNSSLPDNIRSYTNRVKRLHPQWDYVLWTDEENEKLVRTHYPAYLHTYKTFPKNIIRADIIRYLILHRHGGLYLDLDYEMLKPLT